MKPAISFYSIILLFTLVLSLNAQEIQQLADMPERVSNQAVTAVSVDGKDYVYSFSGIDDTKLYTGIHKRAFKYDVQANSWEIIAPLPTGNGRIAASASTVKGKIYVIGGYEVFEDESEISVDLVHVYDPKTDQYLTDATSIPVPIDDHVQVVWRDSLIYVVTGWSNTTNVPDVQIYNPSNNVWQAGTPVPANNTYEVFGSSGSIIGDTIYYAGGAKISGGAFGFSNVLRRGGINPNDPTDITWSHQTSFSAVGYRMGAAVWQEKRPIWIGGSKDAYNYDGIGYSSGLGIEPYERILELKTDNNQLDVTPITLPIMDIREVAQLDRNTIIVCGGMSNGQDVSAAAYRVDLSLVNTLDQSNNNMVELFPNPTKSRLFLDTKPQVFYTIFNGLGQQVKAGYYLESGIKVEELVPGNYQLVIETDKVFITKNFVKQ